MGKIQLSIGDPIEARCTKCRKVTSHIIIAITDAVPVNVECNTCQGQHLYRKPKAVPATAATKALTAKRSEQKKWAEIRSLIENQSANIYSVDAAYKVNAVIMHATFGLGQVQRSLGSRKMEVLFEEGLKKMRCK